MPLSLILRNFAAENLKTMKYSAAILFCLFVGACPASAMERTATEPLDTLDGAYRWKGEWKSHEWESAAEELFEVVVNGTAKQAGTLEAQPMSAQKLSVRNLRKSGVEGLKDLSAYVPNLYYPDYGSRLTSAVYIRGIGSRANTPAVGMYIDDVPLIEKSSFDFSLADAERVEVLRGPQSTLYGRNAMGGLIRVYTLNPLQEGTNTEFRLGTSTKDAGRHMYAHHSHILTHGLGLSVSGFYRGDNGYNRNDFFNRRSNGGDAGGGKLRLYYKRSPRFLLDFQTSGEYSDEDAYDYYNMANKRIEANYMGGYRRALQNSSLKMETAQRRFTLTSVTAYQYLNDRMNMDQDNSPADLFRLVQKQRSHTLSEEIIFKGNSLKWLEWTAGGYFARQWLHTDSPVTFGADGMHSLIQSGLDKGFAAANAAMQPMGMSIAATLTDPEIIIDGLFTTPVTNAAAFGQFCFKDVLTRGLDITAGLRLDYEHRSMDYDTYADLNFKFQMTIPGRPINRDFTTKSRYEGRFKDNQTQLLPRFAVSYHFNERDRDNLVYASVSKGLRSGGYNFQGFGDLMQVAMKNDMMRTLADDPQLGAQMARYVTIEDNPTADSITIFKPETSWNYEVGTHLSFFDKHLSLSAALFYILVHDLQITRFAAGSGLGRQVVNAGESESYGAELTASGWFNLFRNPLRLTANYGYTHAAFTDYDAGISEGQSIDYDGNAVPFAPRHTFSFAADYQFPIRNVKVDIGINTTGVGRTYWTESNSISQPYYQLLGAHMGVHYKDVYLDLWGRNLTNKSYTPFCYEFRDQYFAERGRPRQFGLTLSVKF